MRKYHQDELDTCHKILNDFATAVDRNEPQMEKEIGILWEANSTLPKTAKLLNNYLELAQIKD